MRIAPIGISVSPEPISALVDKVAETCRATHNTNLGISSAAAVAAAISCGVEGGHWPDAITLAIAAAQEGDERGHWVAGARIADRIGWATTLVEGVHEQEAVGRIINLVGTSVAAQESVPAAFALLALCRGDAWKAAILAANIGGDTDTIGSIAAAMAGACSGRTALPQDQINGLRGFDVTEAEVLTYALLGIREARVDLPITEATTRRSGAQA